MEQKLLKTGHFIDNEQFHKMIAVIRNPEIDEKMEEHHILPKCVGGTNDEDNLVMLSLKQHFMVHYYLTFCTIGMLKRKMCFAFKQMLFTRMALSFTEDEATVFSKRYEDVMKEKIFTKNYERTDDIVRQISAKVTEYNKHCVWVNNGQEEHFINSDVLQDFIDKGFLRGRLKNDKISKTLSGRKKKSYEERLKEFEEAIKNKDNKKLFFVHIGNEQRHLSGKSIALSGRPWELGKVRETEEHKKERLSGLHWCTNGKVNTFTKECPDGFRKGFTKLK